MNDLLSKNPLRMAARFIAAFAGDLLVLIFAVVTVWASFRTESSEVYYFPRLVSALLLVFAVMNLILNFRQTPAAPLSVALCKKLLPGICIAVVYIAVCDVIGFYWSAFLAFAFLAACYNPVPFDKRQILLLGVATAAVMGGVYILFDLILQVQTPEPFWVD